MLVASVSRVTVLFEELCFDCQVCNGWFGNALESNDSSLEVNSLFKTMFCSHAISNHAPSSL